MTQALRQISNKEIEAFQKDGFVKLPAILPADFVDELRQTIDDLHERGVVRPNEMEDNVRLARERGDQVLADGNENPSGRFCISTGIWRSEAALKRLCLGPVLATLAAQLYGTSKVNFLIDQVFVKEPGCTLRTAFHSDESYFNCTGEQCATFWVPVDRVDVRNGAMGYVPGSHLWQRTFLPNSFVSQQPWDGFDGERIPDIEGNEALYNVRYLDSEPGDILVHHYRTLHGATGNIDAARIRRAAAFRYGGDDLRFKQRLPEGKGMTTSSLQEGDPMDCDDFPIVFQGRSAA